MTTGQIIAAVTATILILLFTWFVSLKQGRYHGIFRFFAFESITIMIILNLKYWFIDPFSPLQIASWILLFGCIPLAVIPVMMFSVHGDMQTPNIESTAKMVVKGIYKYIRHPMYCSLLVLGFGVFLKHIDLPQILLVLINTLALILTAKAEEGEVIKKFGDEYREYMKKSKMFIPFIF